MFPFLHLAFLQDQKFAKILEVVETLQAEVESHAASYGVPLQWVIAAGGILISAIGALWAWGRSQQKRGDKALEGTIQLLSGKMEKLSLALQEDATVMGKLVESSGSLKEAIYKLREAQTEHKVKYLEEMGEIKALISQSKG